MSIRTKINEVKHLRVPYTICVLENPKQSINLASTIRNVSALGIEKLYIIGGYNGVPKTFEQSRKNNHLLKTSAGANRWTFIKHYNTTEECIKYLKQNKYTIAITSPHLQGKNNTNLYDGKFTQKKLAVFFGNESNGVSDNAIKESDICIQIPMGGVVESLNLGTATGIVLSYIREQRLNFIKDKYAKKQNN